MRGFSVFSALDPRWGLGDGDGLADGEGLALAEGDGLALADGEALDLTVVDADGLASELTLALLLEPFAMIYPLPDTSNPIPR